MLWFKKLFGDGCLGNFLDSHTSLSFVTNSVVRASNRQTKFNDMALMLVTLCCLHDLARVKQALLNALYKYYKPIELLIKSLYTYIIATLSHTNEV